MGKDAFGVTNAAPTVTCPQCPVDTPSTLQRPVASFYHLYCPRPSSGLVSASHLWQQQAPRQWLVPSVLLRILHAPPSLGGPDATTSVSLTRVPAAQPPAHHAPGLLSSSAKGCCCLLPGPLVSGSFPRVPSPHQPKEPFRVPDVALTPLLSTLLWQEVVSHWSVWWPSLVSLFHTSVGPEHRGGRPGTSAKNPLLVCPPSERLSCTFSGPSVVPCTRQAARQSCL